MADVHVSDWDSLVNAVSSAAEETNVYLDDDIDLNIEYPTGVPNKVEITTRADIYIYGGQHSIKNLYHNRKNYIYVFKGNHVGNSSYYLYLCNINFENVVVDYCSTNSPTLFEDYVSINECSISCTLINNDSRTQYQTRTLFGSDRVKINRSSLTITGVGNSTAYPCLYFGGDSWYNNIKLLGDFSKIDLNTLYYSYIHGNFNQKAEGSDVSLFRIGTVANVINATINMSRMITSAGSSLILINTDLLTYPSGCSINDLPENLIKANNSDMHSVSALQQLGFPIR